VEKHLLDHYGAVSAEVAQAMAKGASDVMGANLSLAITGIAGPEGGSAEKPVGNCLDGKATPSYGANTAVSFFTKAGFCTRRCCRLRFALAHGRLAP